MSRDGIVAAGMEGVASCDALHSHPTALHQSVTFYGFEGVVAATGGVAACGWHPGEAFLIASDQENSNSSAHLRLVSSNSVRTSS